VTRSAANGPPALLVLEDGSTFRGRGFGAEGETFGEAVFNTAMGGYQEVLTDPSYAGQIVTMTYPHQGTYGTNDEDPESAGVQVAGFAVREASRRPSNWRARAPLPETLAGAGVVGIEGIDTRRLTLRIRQAGAMRCALSTVERDPDMLLQRVRSAPGMEGADLARAVSTTESYEATSLVGPPDRRTGRVFRVVAYDFGIKRNILRRLAASGCDVVVVPAATPASTVVAGGYDGVFLSNGPGDPAATTYGIEACRQMAGKVPLFGICLGHQLLARALGARTYKLKFGHRGVNQPVLNTDTGVVEITSHNHGFAVDPASFGEPGVADEARAVPPSDPGARDSETGFGRVALTHWNLNDGTLEGFRCLDVPAFAVQYHPEAAPGPHDAAYLFARFRDLMERAA
jgi:carbamoyl-phosphate synthase small subunit